MTVHYIGLYAFIVLSSVILLNALSYRHTSAPQNQAGAVRDMQHKIITIFHRL